MHLRFPRLKAWQWILVALGVAAGAAGVWWILRHVSVPQIIDAVGAWGPGWFFSAFAVLVSFGAPVSPFYLAAGATFPFGLAVLGTLAAMTVNIALSYALARWLLRPVITRIARRLGYTIPAIRPEDRWQITLLARITPGPPFFIQHYLLALAGVPFGTYMVVSVPVCAIVAVGVVAVGAGLASGSIMNFIIGAFVLVAVVVGIRFARRVVQRRAHVHIGPHGEIEPES